MVSGARAKRIARLFVPPIVFSVARRLRAPEWEFIGEQWPKHDPHPDSWDDPSVAERMAANWETYVRTAESSEPLAFGVLTDRGLRNESMHNLLMSYGCVLARAGHGKSRLSILDWGGAFGHYAVVARAVLPDLPIEFWVKERALICERGRRLNPSVSFVSSDEECFSRSYDLVMAVSALQYAEAWRELASRLAAAARAWLFITRLPVVRNSRSFVVLQRPQRYGYGSDHISWVINREELLSHLGTLGFTLERELLAGGPQEYRNRPEHSESLGFLFRRTRS